MARNQQQQNQQYSVRNDLLHAKEYEARDGREGEEDSQPAWEERSPALSFLAHDEPVYAVSITGNASLMCSAAADRSVKIWNVSTGAIYTCLKGYLHNAIASLDFSGEVLASGSREGELQLWRIVQGGTAAVLEGHTAPINDLVFTSDGRVVGTASRDGTAALWDARSGELLASLKGHGCNVDGLRFSLDNQTLATSGADGSAILWSVRTGELVARYCEDD
jgi:WD40 repeat protein